MEFEIKEFVSKIKTQNKFADLILQYVVAPIILILLFFIIVPITFIYRLFSKKKEKTVSQFEKEFENEKIVIERKWIDENFPEDLDYGKMYDIYLCVFRSSPELELFKNRYFDYNFCETKNGIFLISFNKINEGMSLWFLDKNTLEFQKVRDIISSEWDFKGPEGKIILSTTTEKEEIKLEINLQ